MSDKTTPKKRGFFSLGKHWPYVIVLMLLAHATLIVGTIVYVGGKHDTYVDPDYYAKAVDWDEQREMKEAADKEGWTVAIKTELVDDDPAQRTVELQLLDMHANPIDDALVELVCYHPAELARRIDSVLVYDGDDSMYQSKLPIERPGIWVAELTIQRRGVTALLTRDLDVISAPQTATP